MVGAGAGAGAGSVDAVAAAAGAPVVLLEHVRHLDDELALLVLLRRVERALLHSRARYVTIRYVAHTQLA